ncbi:(2Fe-2S)-binding protein [Zooshikella marina]|uniref:Bacterioferritin-associated ferredoxin n=1 Tax=Zooshikella ganghwensis TaxID=202772 RepID=A0A4P9VIK1_9GAMM|nr:(2Fe-2S)-binding protein [Zooshikella ganghwensis]MBU2704728.1 (2Fe-2S)-binding protein [Zooshikella ganghwensis]RDH43058.1 (2Fe-2S)-binding protein [Zooshikella ganghwensis]
MYICLCKNVKCHEIRQCVHEGADNLREVSQCLGVATQCGKCAKDAKQIVKEAKQERQQLLEFLPA